MEIITTIQNGPAFRERIMRSVIVKKFLKMLDVLMTYIWINMTAVVSLFFFKILNRTEVIGQENIPLNRSVLLCSNHQSMIDSFLIGAFAFFPRVLVQPELLPYHPAAFENFFKGSVMRWMSRKWRCIPVRRGERDLQALSQMIKSLNNGTMVIFPEGTRTRTGFVGSGRVGVGKLIYDTKSVVVPVAVQSMNKVLPIGCIFPRLFQKIRLIYGEPVDLAEYYALEPGKATSRLIVDRVVDEIRDLYDFLRLKEYLDSAKKISHPADRDRELAELAVFTGGGVQAVDQQTILRHTQSPDGSERPDYPVRDQVH